LDANRLGRNKITKLTNGSTNVCIISVVSHLSTGYRNELFLWLVSRLPWHIYHKARRQYAIVI